MARHRVEAGGRVCNCARYRSVGGQAGPVLAQQRACGDTTARRLETDRPAAARWNAHRAATIASGRKRAQSRRDSCRGPTAGAAGRMFEAPWIVRGAEKTVFSGRPHAELGEVGLAEDRAALFLQARDRKE